MHDRTFSAADLSPPVGGISRLLAKRERRSIDGGLWRQVFNRPPSMRQVVAGSVAVMSLLLALLLRWRDGAPSPTFDGADWPQRALAMQSAADAEVRSQRLEISAPDAPVRIYLVVAQSQEDE